MLPWVLVVEGVFVCMSVCVCVSGWVREGLSIILIDAATPMIFYHITYIIHTHTHIHTQKNSLSSRHFASKVKEKASTSSRTSLTVQGLSFAFNKCMCVCLCVYEWCTYA
jgi:hypothetical protein